MKAASVRAGKRETTQNIGHVKINIKDVVRNRRLQDVWALQVRSRVGLQHSHSRPDGISVSASSHASGHMLVLALDICCEISGTLRCTQQQDRIMIKGSCCSHKQPCLATDHQ